MKMVEGKNTIKATFWQVEGAKAISAKGVAIASLS